MQCVLYHPARNPLNPPLHPLIFFAKGQVGSLNLRGRWKKCLHQSRTLTKHFLLLCCPSLLCCLAFSSLTALLIPCSVNSAATTTATAWHPPFPLQHILFVAVFRLLSAFLHIAPTLSHFLVFRLHPHFSVLPLSDQLENVGLVPWIAEAEGDLKV